MGFYSFYKILKDMIRTLFGKNFLKITIIVILIFIIFFVYNECFALSTISPIIVDNVTFNFDSGWATDNSSFTGNMDNITILRYEKTNNQYLYCFYRSSFPISLETSQDGSYTTTRSFSYNNNGSKTYYMYNRHWISRSSTSVSVRNPNTRSW